MSVPEQGGAGPALDVVRRLLVSAKTVEIVARGCGKPRVPELIGLARTVAELARAWDSGDLAIRLEAGAEVLDGSIVLRNGDDVVCMTSLTATGAEVVGAAAVELESRLQPFKEIEDL